MPLMAAPIVPWLAVVVGGLVAGAIIAVAIRRINEHVMAGEVKVARDKISTLRRRKGGPAFRKIYEEYRDEMSPKTRREFEKRL